MEPCRRWANGKCDGKGCPYKHDRAAKGSNKGGAQRQVAEDANNDGVISSPPANERDGAVSLPTIGRQRAGRVDSDSQSAGSGVGSDSPVRPKRLVTNDNATTNNGDIVFQSP